MNDDRLDHLDAMRGICALLVVFYHLRRYTFDSYASFPHATLFDKLVAWAAIHGHNAVMAFFVLSGFFITRSAVMSRSSAGGFSLLDYGVKRLSRLWLVLLPCLVATFVLDRISTEFGADRDFAASTTSVAIFVGNVFFLQTILVPMFGSNSPLWSLAYEGWYYLMFGLGFFIWTRARDNLHGAIFCGILLVASAAFVGTTILEYGLVWLLGSAAFLISRRQFHLGLPKGLLVSGLLAAIFVVTYYLPKHPAYQFEFDLLLGLVIAALVVLLSGMPVRNRLYRGIAAALGRTSYTVYLAHYPFLVAAAVIFLRLQKLPNDLHGYAVFAALGLATLIWCVLVYFAAEHHDRRVRRWALRTVRGWRAPAFSAPKKPSVGA
ncbi:MAG TPA: acyltransferase [Bradyrhizobium sp.]|nr:acyltransferase [Bradyrhizobium sp.]